MLGMSTQGLCVEFAAGQNLVWHLQHEGVELAFELVDVSCRCHAVVGSAGCYHAGLGVYSAG